MRWRIHELSLAVARLPLQPDFWPTFWRVQPEPNHEPVPLDSHRRERPCHTLKLLQPELRREPTAYPRRGFQPPLKSPLNRSSGNRGISGLTYIFA